MKKLCSHFTYSLLILVYYGFCILDSTLTDNLNPNQAGINPGINHHSVDINEAISNEERQEERVVDVAEGEAKVLDVENVLDSSGGDEGREERKLEDKEAPSIINIPSLPSPPSEKLQFAELAANKISNGIINDTPIILTLEDSATKELHEKATLQHAEIVTQSQTPLDSEKTPSLVDSNITKDGTDIQGNEDKILTDGLSLDTLRSSNESSEEFKVNGTQEPAITEDIPSFSEWTQKHLEEAEKREPANISTLQPQNQTKPGSGSKLRWKNYASLDCGAKVINANPEAQNTWAILSPSRDEYKLSPCNSRVWFIVELCEAIQVKKIDLANYELFSSSPKEFVVSIGDRYPTRDWIPVGQFTAKDERDIQSFDLNHENFGKYVKIEIKSHYGSEHYCPMSLFRAYGTSVLEVLQKEDPTHIQQHDDDDDDILEPNEQKAETGGNLLSSATDAVISMVKKAASVLGNKSNQSDLHNFENKTHRSIMMQTCNSPSHYVVCNNCTDVLFGKIYEMLSCRPVKVIKMLKIPFVRKAVVNSKICKKFGFDFLNKTSNVSLRSCPRCVETFFPEEYIGAMCNILAITFNKVLRNVSYQYANSTHVKDEKLVDINNIAPKNVSMPKLEDKIIIEPTKTIHTDKGDVKLEPSEANVESSIQNSEVIQGDKDINAKIEPSIVELDIKKVVEDELLPKVLEVPEILESLPNIELELVEETLEPLLTDVSNAESTNGDTATIPSFPPNSVNLQAQKESVFLRLSNRIKALERNMSLSSQYLEELSKRYKKQVEEMQRNLDRTVKMLDEANSRNAEYNKRLEERLEYLINAVDSVLFERDIWRVIVSVVVIVSVTFLVCTFCGRRNISKKNPPQTTHVSDIKKPSQPVKIIVSSPCKREKSVLKVKKKKKGATVHLDPGLVDKKETIKQFSPRSTSTKIWREGDDEWVEGRRVIEDIPFVLEEGDNSTLEILSDPVVLKLPSGTTVTKVPPPDLATTKDKLTIYADKIKISKDNTTPTTPKMNGNGATPVPNGNLGTGDAVNSPKSAKKGFRKLFKKVLSKE